MELVWFELTGYKRFATHSKVNLAEKLVAIVGPNEAGKTSLLDCMLHYNHRNAFAATGGSQELSRGATIGEEDTVAEWTFAIDDGDRTALSHISEAAPLRWYALSKRKSGKVFYNLSPKVSRSLHLRLTVGEALASFANTLPTNSTETDSGNDDGQEEDSQLKAKAEALITELQIRDESLPEAVLEAIAEARNIIERDDLDAGGEVLEQLEALHSHESAPPPSDRIGNVLAKRRPEIILFGPEDRDLESEYDISDYFAVDPNTNDRTYYSLPTALSSLAGAISLDIESLFDAQREDDRGKVKTILETAGDQLSTLV